MFHKQNLKKFQKMDVLTASGLVILFVCSC